MKRCCAKKCWDVCVKQHVVIKYYSQALLVVVLSLALPIMTSLKGGRVRYIDKISMISVLSWLSLNSFLHNKIEISWDRCHIDLGSITSRCSGKCAHTHPRKERLDACDFLCWFKPIMLPPADFRLAKIVAEIITSKQKVLPSLLPWSIAWRGDFDGAET